MSRASTGILGLDAQMSGGIPIGSVMLLTGLPMNAFELLGYHFASAGPRCYYMHSGIGQDEVEGQIERVGGDLKRIRFLPIGDELPALTPGVRLVIDDLGKYISHVGFDVALQAIHHLRMVCKENKTEALLMLPSHGITPAQEIKLFQIADGVLEMGVDRQGFGIFPYLLLKKMRGHHASTMFLLLKETTKGLFMESTRRVN